MNRRKFLTGGIAFAFGAFAPFLSHAFADDAEKELILCLDWSASMYGSSQDRPANYTVQKEGHIAAISDREISRMLLSGRIYVRVMLWSGTMQEVVPIFHGRMLSQENIYRLSESIRKKVPDVPSMSGSTNHQTPLAFIRSLPLTAKRRIIDISTDEAVGEWNARECRLLREEFIRSATAINILAIGVGDKGVANLRENLQTPDGFTDHIENWQGYIPAVKKKIKKELSFV